ncbi:FkbM family methyltransferase [Aliarcobacter cryaerophilus]|uniref:FkbM family methyltransferase n=1 Tax=Aliarcobacter cryaerophilus TaxID=28198 RepID=UPI0021B58D04|nr:FkbM family methyltransferase [Aliarcobacter cryaerophilus]MCT7486738.1 FkbM family methyltransferase [Aliarcobacter cryaerophilus]MCT7490803.1 FkbM family methyltransferase [Aliarcobacter cryaerophilus]
MYTFTKKDIILYENELSLKMPKKYIKEFSKTLDLIKICETEIYWPKEISTNALPWLYHEIYDIFEDNPSSYNHPKMSIENASWIIDAGCCEGYFSLFSMNKNSSSKIIAFEPLKEIKEALSQTFKKELESNRIIILEKALGNKNEFVKFFSGKEHLCDSGITNDKNTTSYDVVVTTLDEIAEIYNIKENNGMIKMDIEGAEINALLGANNLLKNFKPKLAIAVYHEYENAKICKEIILNANPSYKIEFRGYYGYFNPPRPYMIFAW